MYIVSIVRRILVDSTRRPFALFSAPSGGFTRRCVLTINKEQKGELFGLVACICEYNLCLPGFCVLARIGGVGVWTARYLQQRLTDACAIQEGDCLGNGGRG